MQYPIVPPYGGSLSALNVTASTVIKAKPGTLFRVNVTTAGSAPGNVYDTTTVAGAAASNLIAQIPNTVGTYEFEWPCKSGIVYVLGTAQVVSIAYA
jgi:hypothetical protein